MRRLWAPIVLVAGASACDGDVDLWVRLSTGTPQELHAIWGDEEGAVWVGGRAGTLLRWDGTEFRDETFLNAEEVRDIWGTGADDVWIVTDRGPRHYNGRDLNVQMPAIHLDGVWGTASDAVWAVTTNGINPVYRWRGGLWMPELVPREARMQAVHGSGPDDVWAVGAFGDSFQFNGSGWALFETDRDTSLNDVWVAAPDDVWAVGSSGKIFRFDGQAWEPWASGTTNDLNAVLGFAPDDVWVAGDAGTVLHFDGEDWGELSNQLAEIVGGSQLQPQTSEAFNAIWGASSADVWLAGTAGTVFRFNP